MVRLTIKVVGSLITLTAPATLPAAAVVAAGVVATGGLAYGLYKVSKSVATTPTAPSIRKI